MEAVFLTVGLLSFVLKIGRLADLLQDVQAELVVDGADIAMLKRAVSNNVVAGSAQAVRLLLFCLIYCLAACLIYAATTADVGFIA